LPEIQPSINLFYELASQSYGITNGKGLDGSLTTILSIADADVADYYVKDQQDLKNSLLSLANVVIEFGLEDKRFRGNFSPSQKFKN
jgi:hypothetical protein